MTKMTVTADAICTRYVGMAAEAPDRSAFRRDWARSLALMGERLDRLQAEGIVQSWRFLHSELPFETCLKITWVDESWARLGEQQPFTDEQELCLHSMLERWQADTLEKVRHAF